MNTTMSATQEQLSRAVERTSESTLRRYRKNLHWKIYEKEYIFRTYSPAAHSWLDFGCGTGEIACQLALLGARKVIGVDVTPELLALAKKQSELDGVSDRVILQCGDICELEPQLVDVVLAFAVLHHVPDRLEEVMASLRRWLKPDGTFICVEPVSYLKWLQWLRQHSGIPQEALDPGERELTESDLRLIESGFTSSRRLHFNAWRRFSRLWPASDRTLRHIDRLFLRLPILDRLAGTVMLICQGPS